MKSWWRTIGQHCIAILVLHILMNLRKDFVALFHVLSKVLKVSEVLFIPYVQLCNTNKQSKMCNKNYFKNNKTVEFKHKEVWGL